MEKKGTNVYLLAIVAIVAIVGIVFLVQNLMMSNVSSELIADTASDTTGQVYAAASDACGTYSCSDTEEAICYPDENGDCSCPVCSTTESSDLTGQAARAARAKKEQICTCGTTDCMDKWGSVVTCCRVCE